MAYTLYVDKNENFICEVLVKNASTKGSIARLVVESDGLNLVFNGKLDGEKCTIPIKRLKGLLDENVRGRMHLEVIVEDTYFRPWESDFVVEEHTSVKVKVDDKKQSSNKPIVEIKTRPSTKCLDKNKPILKSKKGGMNVYSSLREISVLCEKFGINKNNLKKRKGDFVQILREYFKSSPEYNNIKHHILNGMSDFLK